MPKLSQKQLNTNSAQDMSVPQVLRGEYYDAVKVLQTDDGSAWILDSNTNRQGSLPSRMIHLKNLKVADIVLPSWPGYIDSPDATVVAMDAVYMPLDGSIAIVGARRGDVPGSVIWKFLQDGDGSWFWDTDNETMVNSTGAGFSSVVREGDVNLWAIDFVRYYKIDQTDFTTSTLGTPTSDHAKAICYDPTGANYSNSQPRVWVASREISPSARVSLDRINATTAAVDNTVNIAGSGDPWALTVGGGFVWFLYALQSDGYHIRKVVPDTLATSLDVSLGNEFTIDIIYDPTTNKLFTLSSDLVDGYPKITRRNPSNLAVEDSVLLTEVSLDTGSNPRLNLFDGYLWVALSRTVTDAFRVNPATMEATPIVPVKVTKYIDEGWRIAGDALQVPHSTSQGYIVIYDGSNLLFRPWVGSIQNSNSSNVTWDGLSDFITLDMPGDVTVNIPGYPDISLGSGAFATQGPQIVGKRLTISDRTGVCGPGAVITIAFPDGQLLDGTYNNSTRLYKLMSPFASITMLCVSTGGNTQWIIESNRGSTQHWNNISVSSSPVTLESAPRTLASVDTGSARTVNLPATPPRWMEVTIKDASGTGANINNITINRNGNTIDGAASNSSVTTLRGFKTLLYTGSTWNIVASG